LLENIKNGKLVETTIKVIEKGELDALVHYEAIGLSEIKNKEIAKDLREENRDKEKRLKVSDKIIADKDTRINRLEQELIETRKRLEIAERIILDKDLRNNNLTKENKELKDSYFNIETLSSLPKKQSKIKQLGVKIKTGFQKLKERKFQKQEIVARIEVKNK